MRNLRSDVALATAMAVLAFVYVAFLWPMLLVQLDEGAFLYEAKRILDGELIYRDFFDLIAPLGQHVVALMFAVGGASIETARRGTGLLHASIVALMFGVMRRLGVRRGLAAACCLTDLALFYPAFPMASSHWFSTTFAMLAFWYVLGAASVAPRRAGVAGALTALVALSHQPKGAATAAALCAIIAWDAWQDRRGGTFLRRLTPALSSYALGLGALLLLPLAVYVAAGGGLRAVVDALILFPLGPYRDLPFHAESRWLPLGVDVAVLWQMLKVASPHLLLNVMPLIIPIAALRLALRCARGAAGDARPSLVATVFAASGIASVLYQPNSAHFGIVGPLWLPLYGEVLERLIRRGERAARRAWVGAVATAAVLALVGPRIAGDLLEVRASVRATDRSAFGNVDFVTEAEVADIAAVRAVLSDAGARTLFVYPSTPGVYLLTQTSNPTRFQMLLPGHNTAAHFAEAAQVLERERVPFVVRSFYYWGKKDDPYYRPDLLRPYLDAHYEPVPLPRLPGRFPTLTLLRRKTDTG